MVVSVVSFDIGLVNFAFAVVSFQDPDWTVETWKVANVKGKRLVDSLESLKQLLESHLEALQRASQILIEQQTGSTQRCVATFVWTFCRLQQCVTPQFVRPFAPSGKTTYRERKQMAVDWVHRHRGHIPNHLWTMFEGQRKRDDLADCLRQAVLKQTIIRNPVVS